MKTAKLLATSKDFSLDFGHVQAITKLRLEGCKCLNLVKKK
jgi:hypothetical protein